MKCDWFPVTENQSTSRRNLQTTEVYAMFSDSRKFFIRQPNRKLPSFKEAFQPFTVSMNSSIEQFVGSTKVQFHSTKNSLKRHLESEKVIVQPVQNDTHLAKRIRSDWDLLFFNTTENGHKIGGLESRIKKRQSFLVRGKEMKSFFHLLGRLRMSNLS